MFAILNGMSRIRGAFEKWKKNVKIFSVILNRTSYVRGAFEN